MKPALAEASCAFCGGGSQPYDIDSDGDVVCRPGSGCAREKGRRAPVSRTRVTRAPSKSLTPAQRTRSHCACGRVEGDPSVWFELEAGSLLLTCAKCQRAA